MNYAVKKTDNNITAKGEYLTPKVEVVEIDYPNILCQSGEIMNMTRDTDENLDW